MALLAVLPFKRPHPRRILLLGSPYSDKYSPIPADGNPSMSANLPLKYPTASLATPLRSLPTTTGTDTTGTPHNRGSASRSLRDDTNGLKDPPPQVCKDHEDYLLEDLAKHRVYISLEAGLQNILHVPSDWKSAGHEYQRIISKIRSDAKYHTYRRAYLKICQKMGAVEPSLYKPQAELYNYAISLINEFCDEGHRKDSKLLLHFRVNHPTHITQGIFHPPGLNPDLTGIFEPLKDGEPFVWPMFLHIEEMKDSDAALDTGIDAPRAILKGEKDHVSIHHHPSRKPTKEVDISAPLNSNKRKNTSERSVSNKASRTSQRSSPYTRKGAVLSPELQDNQKTAGARLQCARYLMEMLELSVLRSHALLTLVDRDILQLMYADRSAIITTSIVDLSTPEGEAMFLAMLIAFHRLTPQQWGFLPLVEHSFMNQLNGVTAYHRRSGSITEKRGCLKNLELWLKQKEDEGREEDFCLTLGDIIYRQPGIIGRGTCVVEAYCEDREDWKKHRELVVKVSWPSISRQSEITLLKLAREKGDELVKTREAECHALKSEAEMLQKAGKIEEAAQKLKLATAVVEESGQHWALNHLPNILHSQDINYHSEKEPMPQTKLATFFKNAQIINGDFKYEDRTLRVNVQEKLYKIYTLPTIVDYAQVFYDVLQCHRWLFDYVCILHRDISSGNIMYRIRDKNIYGVLNDLDLSSLRENVENGAPTSFQRTGTPPYMAIELLQHIHGGGNPIRHLYRHDLESLTYVILILCSRNKFDSVTRTIERLPESPFDEWFNPNLSWHNLGLNKFNYVDGSLPLAADIHPTFEGFIPWLQLLLSAFQEGFDAKRQWNRKVLKYNASLVVGRPTKTVKPNRDDTLFNARIGAGSQVPHRFPKPPPFNDENLDGHIDYVSLVRSLRIFIEVPLLYRDKDSVKSDST